MDLTCTAARHVSGLPAVSMSTCASVNPIQDTDEQGVHPLEVGQIEPSRRQTLEDDHSEPQTQVRFV